MKYLSVCSGIEAASVAWEPLGFEPVAFSEIKPFPCSVLAHRFPNVPNMGDMTAYREWPIEPGSIDILVGGTPCQSFSIAGLRGGLEDSRGNLALTYCRILDRFRPRWFVWENVPGAISSFTDAEACSEEAEEEANEETETLWQSSDFATLLGAFRECGYCVSGRILDAQYFGVPQRRRRIFVVGHLGDWRSSAEVLFEPGCLRRDSKKGSKKKSTVAALTATGVGTCGADDNQGQAGHRIAHSLRGEGFDASEDGTGRGTPLIAAAITSRPYADKAAEESKLVSCTLPASDGGVSSGFHPIIATSTGDKSHCLNAGGMGRQDYETETMVVSAFRTAGDGYCYYEGDKTAPLTTGTDANANIIAFSGRDRGDDGRGYGREPNITGPITETIDATKPPRVAGPSIGVRRLTPLECERLQGFPDNWTQVPHGPKGKPAADGPRYQAIGNSMAVPVMRWIGERIQMVDARITNQEPQPCST